MYTKKFGNLEKFVRNGNSIDRFCKMYCRDDLDNINPDMIFS